MVQLTVSDWELGDPSAVRDAGRKTLASQQIYHDLRDRIVTLRLTPGANLSRPELAESYSVSQTPVRDAFLRLEQEGLVQIFPQSRTLVAKIDVEHARETQFLRLGLELEVTRILAEDPEKKRLTAARRILSLQRLALEEEEDLGRFDALDSRFHAALCEAVGVPALWDLVAARSGHIARLRRLNLPDPGKAPGVLEQHTALLAAIEASDLEQTEVIVRRHLAGTLRTVDAIRARYPEYF